ncbi:MAG: PKD domain-containing protein, partial [FCB group bacterium]
MKKLFIIFILFVNLQVCYSATKWVQKNGYKEIQDSSRGIKGIKLSNNGRYLYVVTYNNTIEKIDIASGDTLKTWGGRKLVYDLNQEEESIIEIDNGGNTGYLVRKVYLNTDSVGYENTIPFDNNRYGNPPYPGGGGCDYTSMNVKVSNDCKTFVTLGNINCLLGGYIRYDYTGNIDLRDIDSNKRIYMIEKWMQPLDIVYGKGKQFAYSSSENSLLWRDFPPSYSYANKICIDCNKLFSIQDTINNDNVTNFNFLNFSKSSDLLVGTFGNRFYIWNGYNGLLKKCIDFKVLTGKEDQFTSLTWAGQDKFLLCSFTTIINDSTWPYQEKSYIYFYRPDIPFPIDSIVFDGTGENVYLYPGIDSTIIFTVSARGIIRWFTPDLLSASLIAKFTSDIKICNPKQEVKFYDLSSGAPTSWLWDFGDGTTSTEEEPSHLFTNPGKYSVKLIVSKNGQSDSIIYNDYILVQRNLKADFSSDTLVGDLPLTVSFIDNSSGNIKSWLWWFGDGGTDTSENPRHIYSKPGIFPVRLIISDGFYYDTLYKSDYITVNYKAISDKDFDIEKIQPLNYTNIFGTKAFEGSKGFYLAEGYSNSKTTISRFNSNLEQDWNKILFTNGYHQTIQKAKDNLYYFIGDTVYNANKIQLNRFNDLGNITPSISYTGSNLLFNYVADSLGLYTLLTAIQQMEWGEITVNRFNNYDSIIWKKYVGLSLGYYDYFYSMKTCKGLS